MESSAATIGAPSRWQRIRASLSPAEWRRAGGMAAVIVGLHVVGFGLLFAVVVPGHFELGGSAGVLGVGIGITAYTLGLRHAFDADHIGAIDNTTRKLMTDGQRPLAVGFFFSLGHSTIVFALAALFAIGIKGLTGAVDDGSSTLHQVSGLVGPLGLGHVPDGDRDPQPDGADLDRRDLPPDAPRPLRGGRARARARQPRLHEPLLQAGDESDHEVVADVPARGPVRPRLRHRHRDRIARDRRGRPRSAACPGTRSSACRSCSQPGCRCSTRSTARS